MTTEDVELIVRAELESENDLADVNGHNLSEWSCTPMLEDYRNGTHGVVIDQFWTVFEEMLDGRGYLIFFDDSNRIFGLGIRDDDGVKIKIGEYGSFIKTLWAM